jgi:xanthine dehydrogenase accessory factor
MNLARLLGPVTGDARAALATVVRTKGSTPRHPGSKMVVLEDGTISGTIGGGKIELEVIEAARPVARGETSARSLTKHLVHDLAMCCGGEMELWLEPLDEARLKPLAEAARRQTARRPVALVTALTAPGGKDLLPDDECLHTRRARVEGDRLIEPILPAERVVLFGAGHVAQAVAPLAAGVGFEVVVCDEEERFASPERFGGAQLLHTFSVSEVAAALAPFGPGDFAVILTRDHAVDQEILEALLPRADLTYLGLIGSRGKLGRFRKRLDAKGLGTDERWARLRSPVGLDIGAETPEEIAISIVAELVRERHARP